MLLVERRPDLFSAAVTVGAALLNAMLDFGQSDQHRLAQYGTERATGDRGVAHVASTGFPDFLVNESEVGPAHSHVATCLEVERVWRRCRGAGPVADRARWHSWTNAAERLNAVLHAVSWVDGGTIITGHRPTSHPQWRQMGAPWTDGVRWARWWQCGQVDVSRCRYLGTSWHPLVSSCRRDSTCT